MIGIATKFFKDKNLTLRKVSDVSNISTSTLSYNLKKPAEDWTLKIFLSLAKASHLTIGKVVTYFAPHKWSLNINSQNQTIQGVFIPNKKAFEIIKSTITMECTEGWKPTADDIKYVVRNYNQPHPDIDKDLHTAEQKFGF